MRIGVDRLAAQTQPSDLARVAAWLPGAAKLDDLELLLSGALDPLEGYLNRNTLTTVSRTRLTGVSDPYEERTDVDLTIHPGDMEPAQTVATVLDLLSARGLIAPSPSAA
jgi:hypothetical protein